MREIKHTFDSITQIPGWIAGRPILTSYKGSQKPASRSWDNNLGYEGALQMAREGGKWQEGADAIMDARTEIDAAKAAGRVQEYGNDVAGFAPDVEAFIAGQPDSMYVMEDGEQTEAPIISIGVAVGRSASVEQNEIFNRGAAILSVIDDLEDKGFRVELWAIWNNSDYGGQCDFRVLLKRAEDNWSPHSVAFALCHGAMNRRLMWRIAEAHHELEDFVGGYGVGRDKPEGVDVWFKWESSGYDWETPERALRTAEATVKIAMKYNQQGEL